MSRGEGALDRDAASTCSGAGSVRDKTKGKTNGKTKGQDQGQNHGQKTKGKTKGSGRGRPLHTGDLNLWKW